jgi:hypothetical protein
MVSSGAIFSARCHGYSCGTEVLQTASVRAIICELGAGSARGRRPARQYQESSTALWRLFADLPPKDLDRGGSAPHHHSFGVEAAFVQGGAPVIELADDVGLAVRGAGSVVVELMHVGHAVE